MNSQLFNQFVSIRQSANQLLSRATLVVLVTLAITCSLFTTAAISQDVSTASQALSFDSSEKRALYDKLTHEFRCLKCQNQNLAGSAAGLADDLKNQIYAMVQRGDSAAQITEYMVARYGDFVLYKPAFKPLTLLLWIGPFVLLAAGLAFVYRLSRSSRTDKSDSNPAQVSDAEAMQRARKLLDAD